MALAGEVNDPEVVAEIREVCAKYENALIENDVDVLKELFWQSPLALRFGVAEELYGADEISAFRVNRKINFSERTTLRQDIVTFGRDLAVATLEFSVVVFGQRKHGRQTQVWARIGAAGWRVVSAHVSHKVVPSAGKEAAFGAAAAALTALNIEPVHREGVWRNLQVMAKVAEPLMAFELPPGTEPGPTFEP
jgi:Protein of unknown function (DUF3225)/Protein of unknown function (DUF4089)